MSDYNMKKTALQLLEINGILTKEEVEKCISAISDEDVKYDIIENKPTRERNKNTVFEDENLCLSFKGINSVSNLFFGDGCEFKFIIENKTPFSIRVEATEITINGFVVSNNELICSEAAPNKKTIDSFSLYSRSLDDVDVESPDDIYELEIAVNYEIEEIDVEEESEPIAIEL